MTPPKTKSGLRTIILGDLIIKILKTHRKMKDQHSMCDNEFQGLIFSDSNGNPIMQRKLHKAFKFLLSKSNIPEIRFHDLRHTAATQMLAHGVDILTVSKRLGHAKTSITLDVYAHAVPGLQEKTALIMDEITTPITFPQELIAHELHLD